MSVISLRYAHAFASVASSMKLDPQGTEQQLRDFGGTFAGSRELREVLMNPSIASGQKLKVLDAIAARIGMYPQVRNFVAVVMDHQRLGEFDEIVSEYVALADAGAGVTEAEITTTRSLGLVERAELEAEVSKLAGGKVQAVYRQDPALLGGAIVRIGSTVYDGSVRTQFDLLKQRLMTA